MVLPSTAIVDRLTHDHDHGVAASAHEARTRWIVFLTCAMMIGELIVGYWTNSLALTADGWHMATHAGALGMAALAYWFARTRSREAAFSFGTGKIHALAGYTSAIVLAVVALWIMYESVLRLVHPLPIAFGEALPVAVVGLLVNLVSVKLLHVGHDHGAHEQEHRHEHPHDHEHEHHGHERPRRDDEHVGWRVLDPLMGIVVGVVISRWSLSLCRGAAKQLLDMVPPPSLQGASACPTHLSGLAVR